MEGNNKELNNLFNTARKGQEHYSFEEVKLQFQANLAAGVKPSYAKKGLSVNQWISSIVMVITTGGIIGLFTWKHEVNPKPEKLFVRQENNLQVDTTIGAKEPADTITKLDPLDVSDFDFNFNGQFQTLDLPQIYSMPFCNVILPQNQLDSTFGSWPMEFNQVLTNDNRLAPSNNHIELTEEEMEEMREVKGHLMKAISKWDKDEFAYIPSGKHNGKTVQAFYMSKKEVSNQEYRVFLYDLVYQKRMEEYQNAKPDETQWNAVKGDNSLMADLYFSHPAFNHYPVVNISRQGAEMYTQWLSEEYGKYASEKKWENINPIRLPLRSEWEYAAGLENGNRFTVIDNESQNKGRNSYAPPNFKGPNDGGIWTYMTRTGKIGNNGLYNMLGNAAEMVIDADGTPNALGGNWLLDRSEFEKESFDPYKGQEMPHPGIGFRVVVSYLSSKGSLYTPALVNLITEPVIIMPPIVHLLSQMTGNTDGEQNFDQIGPFDQYAKNWALISRNGKYGFLNEDGEIVVDPKYDGIHVFKAYKKDWALVMRAGNYGFINDFGEEVVPTIYEAIGPFGTFRDDWAMVKKEGKFGFINDYGEVVVQAKYDAIGNFNIYKKNWALVRLSGKYGFINEYGEEVVRTVYDGIGEFNVYRKDWALIEKNGKFGFVNEYGEEIVRPIYDKIDRFGDIKKDWAMVVRDGKRFFINQYGEEVGN